jgi:hypothetical protein
VPQGQNFSASWHTGLNPWLADAATGLPRAGMKGQARRVSSADLTE